ncbi:MAG: hypothetical protein ACJA2M_002987 [Polaribacter sp.]|jgi:hypothetical protein
MFGLFKKSKTKEFEKFYPELAPNERIRAIITEFIFPNLKQIGFEMLKSKLILKRNLGDFQQEIFFKSSRKNSRYLSIKFDPHFFVRSKKYAEWYKDKYGEKIPNDFRISNSTLWASGNSIPNWGKTFNSYSWYNLLERDNQEIVAELNEKILNVAIPYMDLFSDWNNSIDMILDKNSFTQTAMILDFCEMQGNKTKAVEIEKWYVSNVVDKKLKLDIEVRTEIEKRINGIKNWA